MTSTKEKIQNATSKPNLAKAFAVVAAAGAFAAGVGSFASAGAFAAVDGAFSVVAAFAAVAAADANTFASVAATAAVAAIGVGTSSVVGAAGFVATGRAAERGHLGKSLTISGATLASAVSVGALTYASIQNLPAEADNAEEQAIEEVCELAEEKDVIEELRSEGLCL